jgi:nitroreductase
MPKKAGTDYPVHELVASRWSPYAFSDRPVADADLQSLFEAVRWAPSSYNEQPWAFIVATKDRPDEFERLLSCLVEANQQWARRAPVLALGVASLEFARNNKPNRHAFHDLGLAAAHLTFEATSRGLCVHQMAGIQPDKARQVYAIPDDWEAVTGIAIGYPGEAPDLPERFRQRDEAPRTRKPQEAFVFQGGWQIAWKPGA